MWIIYAIGASLFWGFLYVLREQVYKKISIFTSIAISTFVVFVVTVLISYFTGKLKPDLVAIASSKQLFWYLASAIGVLLFAEIFIASSIVAKNATLAGLIEISYPIFIALFSYILFKQNVSFSTILGGILVFIGIFVIYFFNK